MSLGRDRNIRFTNFGLISASRILRVFPNKGFIIVSASVFIGSAELLIYGEILGTIVVCLIFYVVYSWLSSSTWDNNRPVESRNRFVFARGPVYLPSIPYS